MNITRPSQGEMKDAALANVHHQGARRSVGRRKQHMFQRLFMSAVSSSLRKPHQAPPMRLPVRTGQRAPGGTACLVPGGEDSIIYVNYFSRGLDDFD